MKKIARRLQVASVDTLGEPFVNRSHERIGLSTLPLPNRLERVGFSDCLVLEIAGRAGHLPLGTFELDGAHKL